MSTFLLFKQNIELRWACINYSKDHLMEVSLLLMYEKMSKVILNSCPNRLQLLTLLL